MAHIIIVGGGIGGSSSALELADAGHQVTLIESRSRLLSGSSDSTPCRLGLGFHYHHIPTAIMYLRATLKVVKKYKEFVVGADKNSDYFLRRGWYFYVKDSEVRFDKVSDLYNALKMEYSRLIAEDPTNEVFGSVKDFYRFMVLGEYIDLVNGGKVCIGMETAEQTLDWPKFKNYFIELIQKNVNITVYLNTEVTQIQSNGLGEFILKGKKTLDELKSTQEIFQAPYVQVSTWERIESLAATAGYQYDPTTIPRTNRLKALAHVRLPKSLENIHSMFFSYGSHCSITNIGDCKAYVSFEPETNMDSTEELEFQSNSRRLLSEGGPTKEEKWAKGQKIIAGAAMYVPEMAKAELCDIRYGNVRTKGEYHPNSATSDHHRRDDHDIKSFNTGILLVPCMKLLYFQEVAERVNELLNIHIQADQVLGSISAGYVNSQKGKDHRLKPAEIAGALRDKINAEILVKELSQHQILAEYVCDKSANLALQYADQGLWKITELKPFLNNFSFLNSKRGSSASQGFKVEPIKALYSFP